MEDSTTVSHQNPKLKRPALPFDDKAPIVPMEDRGCQYREQGIRTAMIQAGAATEARAVRMVQDSMAVDPEADRLKVSCFLTVEHQPNEQQQCRVHLCCLSRAGLCFDCVYLAVVYILELIPSSNQASSITYTRIGIT